MIKTIIDTFWQSAIVNGKSFLSENTVERIKRARLVVSFFYLLVFVTSMQTFGVFSAFPAWDLLLSLKDLFDPIWSVKWIPLNHWELVIRALLLLFLGFSVLCLILWERSRLVRIGLFLSMFFYLSVVSSFGKIDHFMHIMTLASFFLIFAPTKVSNKDNSTGLLQTVFGIQTFILLAYFVSGFFKFYGIIDQNARGVVSALSPDALGQNVSKTMIANSLDSFGSAYVLNNPSLLLSVFLIGGFFIEFFSIYVIFKPSLHRTWGVLLMLLHTGILLTVGPDFSLQMFVVGIFLFFSPFVNLASDIVGDLSSLWSALQHRIRNRKTKNEFIIFYDGDCLMCNGFITYLSKFELPDEIRLSKLKSERFSSLAKEYPALTEIDAFVVLEASNTQVPRIRIKANALLWVLAKLKLHFSLVYYAYKVAPFIGNVVYDLIAKNREIPGADNCPIPPEKIRKIILT